MATSLKLIIDYKKHIDQLLYQVAAQYFVDQEAIKAIRLISDKGRKRPEKGVLRTRPEHPLQFENGGILQFREDLEIVDGRIKRPKYSYHFELDDYYFRYDRDLDASQITNDNGEVIGLKRDHAECHLHVNDKAPRFMTHATSFEEVLYFILVYFYDAPIS